MGPKLRDCKPEQPGTKEYGKMLKRIHILGDGRVPAKEGENWKTEGQKKEELREKSIRGFQISLKWKVSWRGKVCGTSRERKCAAGQRSFA